MSENHSSSRILENLLVMSGFFEIFFDTLSDVLDLFTIHKLVETFLFKSRKSPNKSSLK